MTRWWQVIGHEWAAALLESDIKNERLGHAYLFAGPPQIGKTTLARTFAQALNCTKLSLADRPCGRCRACLLIQQDRHPDVRLVQGESSGRGNATLKIDQIRSLQQELNLTAAEGRYKIAILRNFQEATISASNAFLKTLEEPPPSVILMLTATTPDNLLPTIVSRCRVLSLRAVKSEVVRKLILEQEGESEERAGLLAQLSGGRVGWALSALHNPEILERRTARIDVLFRALEVRRVGRFALAAELTADQAAVAELLVEWLTIWRDLALLSNGASGPGVLTNSDYAVKLKGLANLFAREAVARSLRETVEALTMLEQNVNVRLMLENLLLSYPVGGTQFSV